MPYLNVYILVPADVEPLSIENSKLLFKESDLVNTAEASIEDFSHAYSAFGGDMNVEFNLMRFMAKDVAPGELLQSSIVLNGVNPPDILIGYAT